jgi:hypothetical protein
MFRGVGRCYMFGKTGHNDYNDTTKSTYITNQLYNLTTKDKISHMVI